MANTLGIFIKVTRDERVVAYLAIKAKGKVKGKDLGLYGRLRDEVIGESTVIADGERQGQVEWVGGTIRFENFEALETLAKAVDRLLDTDGQGVDIDLATAAQTVQDALAVACREHAPAKVQASP